MTDKRLRPPAGSKDVTSRASGMAFIGAEAFGCGLAAAKADGNVSANLRYRVAVHESAHCVACLCLGIPLRSATIENGARIHRGTYRPPHDAGVECMVILCLAGAEAERAYCGPILDDGDRTDVKQAREILARAGVAPLWIGAEIERLRDAARRLVTSPFARQRIPLIASALLARGTLSGAEIVGLRG